MMMAAAVRAWAYHPIGWGRELFQIKIGSHSDGFDERGEVLGLYWTGRFRVENQGKSVLFDLWIIIKFKFNRNLIV